MGRKVRKISFIREPRDRRITFRKRYSGILKKIHELAVLCNVEVYFYAVDSTDDRVRMFSSSDREFIPNYRAIMPEDRKGPRDMQHHYIKPKTPVTSTPPPAWPGGLSDAAYPQDRSLQVRKKYSSILPRLSKCDGILTMLANSSRWRLRF